MTDAQRKAEADERMAEIGAGADSPAGGYIEDMEAFKRTEAEMIGVPLSMVLRNSAERAAYKFALDHALYSGAPEHLRVAVDEAAPRVPSLISPEMLVDDDA